MKKRKTLGLCMIVKNEEHYLPQCLSSIQDIVDEMIIVDTGSTDRTIEIAESFGAKVYHFAWEDDFSKARNFALNLATSDWLLLLDADEALDPKSKKSLIKFINTSKLDGCHFAVYNYIGDQPLSQYSIHHAFRLLRNNLNYVFTGAIHEQITPLTGTTDHSRFATENIILFHYGYLTETVLEKDKHGRNVPILLKLLEAEPHNPFYLFNMGNEYITLQDIPKAISTYEHALQYTDPTQGYAPYLYHRLIMALYTAKAYDAALARVREGFTLYPLCTDILYLKGLVHIDLHQYTLAIDTFNQCLDLGDPPATFKFVDGCGTYKPYLALGEIYVALEDYNRALDAYTSVLNKNPSLYATLYCIGNILNKMPIEKSLVSERLRSYFSSMTYLPNLYLYIDILTSHQIYDEALSALADLQLLDTGSLDKAYLFGKYYFFTQQYDLARETFNHLFTLPVTPTILPNIITQSTIFLYILSVLKDPTNLSAILEVVQSLDDPILENICLQFDALYNHKDSIYLTPEHKPENYMPIILDFLDKLLTIKAFDLFESSLYILNFVDSNTVLLELSKLYAKHSLKSMTVKTLLQSIKELDMITKETAYLLFHDL